MLNATGTNDLPMTIAPESDLMGIADQLEPLDKFEKDLIDMAIPAINQTVHFAIQLVRSFPNIRVQRDTHSVEAKSISSFFNIPLPGFTLNDDFTTTTMVPMSTTTLETSTQPADEEDELSH